MRAFQLVFLAGLLLGVPGPSWAADPEEEALEMELFFAPAETVSSASRYVQPIELSPSAVTVLTREDIQSSGARTLPELLRLVVGMDINLVKPFWYRIGVRGNSSLSADTMLLLVDGRDLTMEFFGFPAWSAQHFSVDDIERIEVVRGPGSSLYGANAYAGVVHVITRKPGSGPLVEASVRGGEHGQVEMACRGDAAFDGFALAATVGVFREDFWTSRDELGRGLLRGRLDGRIDLGRGQLLLETGALRTSGNFYTDLGTPEIKELNNLYGKVRYEHGDLMAQVAFDHIAMVGDVNIEFVYGDLELATIPPFDDLTVDKLLAQVQHTAAFLHNRLTFGGEYILNRYHSTVMIDPTLFEHRGGLYLQDEFDISELVRDLASVDMPRLILTAGLRLDLNSVTQLEISPRASLVFIPFENHSFRAGYAHAFLKPTLFESRFHIHLESEVGFDEIDFTSPDLGNETIDSLEFGYTGKFFDGRLVVQLDFAQNWYAKFIDFRFGWENIEFKQIGLVSVPDLNGPGFEFSNSATGTHGHDLELQVTVKPTDGTRLFVLAAYRQLYHDDDGSYITAEPALSLVGGGDWRSPSGLAASLRAFYTGERTRGIGNPGGLLMPRIRAEMPAVFFLNARVAWTFVRTPATLTAGIEGFNLLGHEFREYPGIIQSSGQDFAGERLGRRVVLFLQGEI